MPIFHIVIKLPKLQILPYLNPEIVSQYSTEQCSYQGYESMNAEEYRCINILSRAGTLENPVFATMIL